METPTSYELAELNDPRLQVRQALPVQIDREDDDDGVTLWQPDREEYGHGDDVFAAMLDLQDAIAERYWFLKAKRQRLAPHLLRVLHRAETLIEEIA